MPMPDDLHALLDALREPALLVDRGGVIRAANRAAYRKLLVNGSTFVGRSLAECAADPPARTEGLLQRCRRSGDAVIGTIQLTRADGAVHQYRSHGCRIDTTGGPDVLLRLEAVAEEAFLALTEKVIALNREIAKNKRVQLLLRTALAEKELLLKELNHRVRNNLQTLLSMLSVAEQRAPDQRASEPLRSARMRVEAMAIVQRLVYRNQAPVSVDGYTFLEELCHSVARSIARPGIDVELMPCDVALSLDAASAVGLIVNELLTNGLKYAFANRDDGRISVALASEGEGRLRIVVEDNGQGPRELPPSGSGVGLALVQGLANRFGGACEITSERGTRCIVTLIDRQLPQATSQPIGEEGHAEASS
jgi:two-component sensor histidine kinase